MESLEKLLALANVLQSQTLRIDPLPPMNSHLAEQLMERARALEETGDLRAALACLERAQKAPSHVGEALCEQGRLQRRRGERHEALTSFKHALHHVEEPVRVAWIYSEMGQLYFAMREDEEATYYFRRAASMDSQYDHLLERTVSAEHSIDVHALDTADIEITTLQ